MSSLVSKASLGGRAKRPASSSMSSDPTELGIRVASNIDLTAEVETVLRSMFRDFSQIAVEAEFGRGFSGSRAFRVRLVERGGRAHLPAVVKIARRGLINKERQAYKTRVEHTLPNIARLEETPGVPADSPLDGLRYALVGSGTFEVQSLHDYYREADADDVCWVLENRLFEIMGPSWWFDNRADRAFQMQADYYDTLLPVNLMIRPIPSPAKEKVHLVEPSANFPFLAIAAGDRVRIKDFVITKVDLRRSQLTLNVPPAPEDRPHASFRVRLDEVPDITRYRMDDVIDSIDGVVVATRHDLLADLASQTLGQGVDLSAKRLTISSELSLPNPLLSYQGLLQDFLTVNVSTIHGDLNLENILIDPATREVSLIDFANVREGHTLHDLLRLETEVVIMLIPPALAKAGLPPETIYPFYEQLYQLTLYPGRSTTPRLPTSALEKPFKMLLAIRQMARKCLFNWDDWREYYRGLTIYLLGALKFESLAALPTAPLPRQVAFWGAATAQHLLLESMSRQKRPRQPLSDPPVVPKSEGPTGIEPPYGTVRPDSGFYIERAADGYCWQHVTSPYAATLFVQAPMQMGKSSLIRRILHRARKTQEIQSAFIDFQTFTKQYFEDEENFFIQLCLMISDALEVPEAIDPYWKGRRTNIVKCSRYLSEHIIPALEGPFILAMDEVERMLTCPFRANFFGMLRTWHNKRAYDDDFAKMTLFLSSSTDPYLLIDNPHQSPFNVATPILLQDFTLDEVRELNRRHNLPLSEPQVIDLMDLVNGHPFLTRVALYQLALGKIDMPTLLAQATDDRGPFGEHLRHYLRQVMQQPELKQVLINIFRHHAWEENRAFYALKEAGLIMKDGKQVVLRNTLYERYFKERLNG